MESQKIEKFFLTTLLRISIAGVALILVSDAILYPQDTLSLIIDSCVLTACVVAYVIRNTYPTAAILMVTIIVMLAMFYQCLAVPVNTTTSLSILLIEGFIFSVLLKGRVMWIMHGIVFIAINAIFILQFLNPELRFSQKENEVVTVAITYSILYFILTYASGVLKYRYDKIHQYLRDVNRQLYDKAMEIEAQNEELTQIQDNLNALNKDLEKMVIERTERLKIKNDRLIRYSYTNAHHLRGPIARLLGLVAIHKLDPNPDHTFFFTSIEEQAHEIDTVVKQINIDLGTGIIEEPAED